MSLENNIYLFSNLTLEQVCSEFGLSSTEMLYIEEIFVPDTELILISTSETLSTKTEWQRELRINYVEDEEGEFTSPITDLSESAYVQLSAIPGEVKDTYIEIDLDNGDFIHFLTDDDYNFTGLVRIRGKFKRGHKNIINWCNSIGTLLRIYDVDDYRSNLKIVRSSEPTDLYRTLAVKSIDDFIEALELLQSY